jgi:hypothetical protein
MSNDGLARTDVHNTTTVRDPQQSFQDDREFLEFRGLPGLRPTAWTAHAGDADLALSRIHATDVFIDQLRFIAGCFYSRWRRDQRWHLIGSSTFGPRLPGSASFVVSHFLWPT